MKTKKISWQAIAIVVLALVLIASIALGVSGAWFQDKDSESQDTTMGAPVLIKLADKTTGDVKKWSNIYTHETLAYPGDDVLGATKVMAATATPTIYRAKIVTSIKDAKDQDVTIPEAEPSFTGGTDYDDWTGANPTGTVNYSPEEISYNAWKIGQMLANLKNVDWSKKEGSVSGYIYYKEVTTAAEIVLFENGLKLSEELTNACSGWKISISLDVEAIQAANANAEGFPWDTDDMPGDLVQSITNYNNGRK